MKIEGHGKCLRIYIGESDQWHHRPLHQAIIELVRKEGLAGATVIRGIAGYGANSRLHTTRILRLSEDLPIVIEVIDRPERIEAVLPKLNDMVCEGLITVTDTEVVFYRPGAST